MGIDPTGDIEDLLELGCNGGHRRPVASDHGQGGTHQRADGQNSDGASGQVRIKSHRTTDEFT
ncbi:hypothetical protein GCM10022254_53490 [Actinomadura meridiana]|uniref:Uncharacterized protein n=1 Tax=Actinomadura meridiana TaxID=559626 RepID=A0ABP8CEF8_9ACTN